ncbi:MAG: hypothetical protein O3B01_03445 [Planctomycetota bacterium]|nr:hypothetical protein [Planctomycetota bacterium]MDA1137614.1 hypothetical protein [Planctomycetota bacterium]
MKLLEEIPGFPGGPRQTLESEYGIETAEAFFAHVVSDEEGMRSALKLDKPELQQLSRLVEGYLSPDYISRCRKPARRHARGAIID